MTYYVFFREETELFLELCDSNNHATIVSDCMNNYAKMDDYVKQVLEGHDPLPDGEYNVIICREEDAKQQKDRPIDCRRGICRRIRIMDGRMIS